MTDLSEFERRRLFAAWLRTGRLPQATSEDGRELKFNPWHDPADGRFTTPGGGGTASERGAGPGARRASLRSSRGAAAIAGSAAGAKATLQNMAGRTAKSARSDGAHGHAIDRSNGNRLADFAGGVGEGLYAAGKAAVSDAYALVTTNPVTTVRENNAGVAAMLDQAIAAEDTPAYRQIARAGRAVANASARDIGRVSGQAVGAVAIGAVPTAGLSRVANLRRLKMARVRPTIERPAVTWSKETLRKGLPSTLYNDAAPGARPGLAPTLMRRMPNGAMRPVKFDGIDGEYMIDRKWKVVNLPHARAQVLRQSKALAQNGIHGMWEVPDAKQKVKAFKIIKNAKVTNIKTRVVEP